MLLALKNALFVVALAQITTLTRCQSFGLESCPVRPSHLWVEPDAPVTIGAVLPIHRSGDGLYGCGPPSTEGIQVFEAMRWAVDVLNRKSGLISDTTGQGEGSLIPGVKIGLKVYDTCEHGALAVEHLTTLFPVLRSGPKSCESLERNSSLTVGVVDMSESVSKPEVSEPLRDYLIPSIQLSLSAVVPPEKMAHVLLSAAGEMGWTHVSILHEDEEYSISAAKIMTQRSAASGTCVTAVHALPDGRRSGLRDRVPFRKTLKALLSRMVDGSAAVVLIKNQETAARFLQVVSEFPEHLERIQWLFSWIPPPGPLAHLKDVFSEKVRLYSITPYPSKIAQFEDYWSLLSQTANPANKEDRWFLEYLMSEKNCQIPGFNDPMYSNLPLCTDRDLSSNPIEMLLRTSRAVPALTSVFTLATAFQKAWEFKCDGNPGVCPELRGMSRKEFVSQFLEPVEYIVGKDKDSFVDDQSRRRIPRDAEKLEGNKLALAKFDFDKEGRVRFSQVLVFEGPAVRLLDDNFVSTPSACSGPACRGCVRPRQSRLEDPIQRIDVDFFEETLENDADILIPLLLPLHRQGLSPAECGEELNPEAVQNLEAAFWTVDRINEDRGFLADSRLGIHVIDSCSSPLLATQRLTTYVTNDGGALSSLVVVSADSVDSTLAANRILRPLNVSVLSTSDLTPYLNEQDRLGMERHLMQIETSFETIVEAAIDVFASNGWKFVSVVHTGVVPYRNMAKIFVKAAKSKGMCVGAEIQVQPQDMEKTSLTRQVQRMVDVKSQGSRVVVLLTDADSTKALLSEVGRFLEASAVKPGDLVMVGLGDWRKNLDIVGGLEKVALGSLVFKEEQGEVSEFVNYFRNMAPENNFRNPWIVELLERSSLDASGQEGGSEYLANIFSSTTNTIQSIVAVAAGIASLRNELCQLEMGLCPEMSQGSNVQRLAGEHILRNLSPRLDYPGQTFHFTEGGYGDMPVGVYNLRRMSNQSINYMKVGSYKNQLIKLSNMVTYTSSGEVTLDSVVSDCLVDCFHCQRSSSNQAIIASSTDLYIAVVLGVHEPSHNPLSCGPMHPTKGVQSLESIFWAVDTINEDADLLPGADLGVIVFDSCGSRERVAMDVSNFLTGKKEYLPPPEQVVGFLAEGSADIIKPLVDVATPLGMVTVSTSAISPEFADPRKYPNVLKMSMPSDVVIASMVDILKYFHWKYVSVVYMDGVSDFLRGPEAFEELKRQAEQSSIEIAVSEKIKPSEDLATTMDIIAHRLKIKENAGARAVVLLLSPSCIGHLLSAVKRLQQLGRSRLGDFIWIAYDTLEPFQMFPDQSMSALILRKRVQEIRAFKDYFAGLDVKSNSRNPWFREYWEQAHNCRGSSCNSDSLQSSSQFGFVQDRSVPGVVNGLFTLALGLDTLRQQLCPSGAGFCAAMKDHSLVREKLFGQAKKFRFMGADGNPVHFGDKNYVSTKMDVYNFRDVGDVRAFMNVGVYDEASGLSLNVSSTKGFNSQGFLVPLSEVASACNDSEACMMTRGGNVHPVSPAFMKIPTNQEFVIGVMMSVHQPGDSFFTCSQVIEESSVQNLMALSYALNLVNSNTTVLPEIQLGAMIFDHCGRRQKAEEQVFSFIASEGSLPYSEAGLRSRAMIAALTYDPVVADDLSPLFESVLIPQIATPTGLMPIAPGRHKRFSRSADEIQVNTQVLAIADTLSKLRWEYVTLIHSGSESDRKLFWNFVEAAKDRSICISRSVIVQSDASVSQAQALLLEELDSNSDSRVVVMLLEDSRLVEMIMDAARRADIVGDFVWVGMESEKGGLNVAKFLQGVDVDFFVIRPETYDVPGFRDYSSKFSLRSHDPIPDAWFEEFWQQRFQCHLPQSAVPMRAAFPEPCRGSESLISAPLVQDPLVHHTVRAVGAVADALHDYLRRYCAHGDAATSLEDCGPDARQVLWRETRKLLKGPPSDCVDGDCGPLKMAVVYQVFKLKRAKIQQVYQQVGLWKKDQFFLNVGDIEFLAGRPVESVCRQDCDKCLNQLSLDPLEYSLPKPGLYSNFKTTWGVAVSALSLLGVLLVIICAAYFLMSFQVTIGTTVLGYMILFGLLLLYAVNFAFVLSPTEGTCGVRRFGLGLAYAIVFAGMLVKVMNIWRMMGYRGNQYFGDSYHVTSPAALLVVAVGLVIIQVILSSAWLILIPPTTGIHGGEWRCHPATTFEDELVISLVYVMLMLAITILFSILTWSSKDNNREARWILTCCCFIAVVWIAWTVLSTQVLHRYRDLTISAANLVCATVVMLCMYLRKVYLYNKLTRDQEKKARLKQTVSLPPMPNMYGSLSRTTPNITPVTAYNSSARLVGMSGKLLERVAPPSRMALISPEDGSSSDTGSGSVQVQATDLYPLEMYDGGSQFQPSSLRLGGSSLIIDEATNQEKS